MGKENFPFVSWGIIGLCDVILVSSDSISMVTESNQVKPTVVFDTVDKGVGKKHSKFLDNLYRGGYSKKITADNLEDTVKKILNKEVVLKHIDNRRVIEQALDAKL